MIESGFDLSFFSGIRDSKQLSEKEREAWYLTVRQAHDAGLLRYAVTTSSHEVIDRRGIVPAIRSSIDRVLVRLEADPKRCALILDGGLRAPSVFLRQETIIRGDESEPLISAASIMAKVTRDKLMKRLGRRFPAYGFEVHKGYGTKKHREAIGEYGLCDIHRLSFCTRLVVRD